MRLRLRRRVVFVNLARPRLGLSEGDAQLTLHPSTRRRDSQIAFVAGGAGFKLDAQGDSPGRRNPQGMEVPSEQ